MRIPRSLLPLPILLALRLAAAETTPHPWVSHNFARLSLPRAQGVEADDWNGFAFYKNARRGPWGWGAGFENAEWNMRGSGGGDRGYGESRGYLAAVEWERPGPSTVRPYAAAQCCWRKVSLQPLDAASPGAPRRESGDEWSPGVFAGGRWFAGKRMVLELSAGVEYHASSWNLDYGGEPDRGGGDGYWSTAVLAGLGVRY